tara:strand:+ start:7036 stop:7899 length:864 start_codon:yes stop_codon:yes gene_type:complete
LNHYQNITELSDGKIYALQNIFELDGKVSAYPSSTSGFSCSNSFLIYEKGGALLLDTGYTSHEDIILKQLSKILKPNTPLSIFPLRINEFMSVGNAMAIAKEFNVIQCYSHVPEMSFWLDFETTESKKAKLIPTTVLKFPGKIEVGEGERIVDAFRAPIQLIATRWVYDQTTKTLFTSDSFTQFSQKKIEGPWIMEENNRHDSYNFAKSFLLNSRYWWLEGANTLPLRNDINEIFQNFEIHTIAPGYGSIINGEKMVNEEFSTLMQILEELDRERTDASYVHRDIER